MRKYAKSLGSGGLGMMAFAASFLGVPRTAALLLLTLGALLVLAAGLFWFGEHPEGGDAGTSRNWARRRRSRSTTFRLSDEAQLERASDVDSSADQVVEARDASRVGDVWAIRHHPGETDAEEEAEAEEDSRS